MKIVNLKELQEHLAKYQNPLSLKYIDGNRYYFYKKKIIAKIVRSSYYII